jgi:hypothetical protein
MERFLKGEGERVGSRLPGECFGSGDLERDLFLTPISFLLSFSRIIRSNSFRGSSIMLKEINILILLFYQSKKSILSYPGRFSSFGFILPPGLPSR